MLKKWISWILTVILLAPAYFVQEGKATDKYTDPLLIPTETTYIRKNFGGSNYSDSNTIVVDAGSGSHRISFIRFSGEGYEKYLSEATSITLELSAKDAAGAEEDGNSFSLIPLGGAAKDIDLSTITYDAAKTIYADGVSLVDYNPDTAMTQGVYARRTCQFDVTDYCKQQTDTDYLFMLRSVKGAYTFFYTDGGTDVSLKITSAYTDIANKAAEAATYIYNRYNAASVSDAISFETSYNGFDISYESLDPEYISDNGNIVKKPSASESDKECVFDVTVTSSQNPNVCEKAKIVLNLLGEGKYAATATGSEDGISFDFKSFTSKSKDRLLLDIPLLPFVHSEKAVLKFCGEEIDSFTINGTKSDYIKDVTDIMLNNPDGIFMLTGVTPDKNTFFAPKLMDLSLPAAEAVENLVCNSLYDFSNITNDIVFPTKYGDYFIKWESSDKAYISDTGRVNRGDVNTNVTLNAVLSGSDFSFAFNINATVIRTNTDIEDGKYPALHDPMTISDEALFGKWNETESTWDTAPILRYDLYKKDLALVLSDVKRGDYESAKFSLLSYYRLKDETEKYCYEPASGYDIAADAMNDKIWTYSSNDTILGQAYVGTDWDWYSIDLTDVSTKNRLGTYWLLDADMNGSALEIASKENDNGFGAYFEVVSNGVKSIIPVEADAYISAGDNKETNYGSSPLLYCREEAESSVMPISSDTGRPYFRFDLSGINISAVATSVKLNFYGHTNGTKQKKIYCLSTNLDKNFAENEFHWSMTYPEAFCFKQTGFIWLSVPEHENVWHTEYEWLNYSTRFYQPMWLLRSYLLNGNEEYVYRALEFAMSQCTQQPVCTYPRSLDSGWRIQNLIRIMYTAIDSQFMTPEIFTALLKYTYGHINALKDVTLSATNQDSAVKVNVARICAFFPEITEDDWWEKSKNNLYKFYSGKLLNEDGSYTESCSNYISGVADELVDAIKMIQAREGKENEYYQCFMEQLKKLVTYYMNLGYSNRLAVPYGDGGRSDISNTIKPFNEVLQDDEIQYFVTKGEEGTVPTYTSMLFPKKAVCMMRSGWNDTDLCAFLNNDNGGTHGHDDELALDVTAFGKYLLVDAGVSSYSEGSDFANTRQNTLYHNTIQIDDANQEHLSANVPGYTDFQTNQSFDFLHAATDLAYLGFTMNRKVLMLKNKYIIVSDYIKTKDDQPHTYRQLWHPDYNNTLTLNTQTGMAYTNRENQPNIKMIPADSSAEPQLFYRLMNASRYGEIQSKSVMYSKENAIGDQSFDIVLYPEDVGVDDTVTVNRIAPDSCDPTMVTSFSVTMNDNIGYYYSSNEETPQERTFGKYSYDGEMAYVETDADSALYYIAMVKGKELKDYKNADIVKSAVSLKDFSAVYESSSLKLYSSEALSSEVSIASEKKYNTVYLNGTEVEFKYNNGVITTKGIKKSDTATGNISPGSPSGAGSFGGSVGGTVTPDVPPVSDEPSKKEFPFSDCSKHWSKEYVQDLYSKGIVSGMSDTTFEPDTTLTRSQFVKLIVSACGLDITSVSQTPFTDVDLHDWYAPYVAAAYAAGIISGYEDGSFQPNHTITREEMAKTLSLAADYVGIPSVNDTEKVYADSADISDWAVGYIDKVSKLGIFSGDSENKFNPNLNASRGEAAAVICRLLRIKPIERGVK